jgi:DNA polymerase III delta subunit
MLYFIYGTDGDKVREKANGLAESLLKKKPDASLFELNDETWSGDKVNELTLSQGLFEQKYIVLLKNIFSTKQNKEDFIDRLEAFKESTNIFISAEGKVDAASLKKIEKHAEKVQEYEAKAVAEKEEFNNFALANALGVKDKKNLWVLYHEAKAAGAVDEQLAGLLFWKIKSMILSGGSPKWNVSELKVMAEKLVEVQHDSRRGKGEVSLLLERLLLSF